MADKQINDLPSGGALQDADLLVLQRSGTAMNILGSQLAKASDITTLQTNVADRVDKTVTVTSIRDFLADSNNGIGAYILNVQNATDNPRGTGNVASAIMYKHTAGGGYSEILVFAQGRMWVSANTVTSNPPETITWTEFASQSNSTITVQIQLTLPSTVTVPANGTANLLTSVDPSTLTKSATIHGDTIPTGRTLYGAVFLWTNSSVCSMTNCLVEANNKLTLTVYNHSASAVSASAVRLLLFYR